MKAANKEYNTTRNKYELVFKDSGSVEKVEHDPDIPEIEYDLKRYTATSCIYIVYICSLALTVCMSYLRLKK